MLLIDGGLPSEEKPAVAQQRTTPSEDRALRGGGLAAGARAGAAKRLAWSPLEHAEQPPAAAAAPTRTLVLAVALLEEAEPAEHVGMVDGARGADL